MKRILISGSMLTAIVLVLSCNDTRRGEGRSYMPDMAYSRAYETYAALDSAKFTSDTSKRGEGKIYYTSLPVPGTIAMNDSAAYEIVRDTVGGYNASVSLTNPMSSLSGVQMKEAERLYLVNCAICHGPTLNGNGPLYKDGNGPFPAAPKNLVDDAAKQWSDGQMFYVMTFGKNAMGSYASQLTTDQRWMIVSYIRSKQGGEKSPATTGAATTTGGTTTGSTSTDTTGSK